MRLIPPAAFAWSLVVGLSLCLFPGPILGQEAGEQDITSVPDSTTESTQTQVQVFEEIELTPEGVVAFDTAGHRWVYDFGNESFEIDDRDVSPDIDDWDDRSIDENYEPVEDRCVKELKIGRSSMKAVFVGYDEYVNGDIIAYDRITVKGWVRGSVQSINKRVLVTASGRVDGDIRAPRIIVKEGAVVLGDQIVTEQYNIPVDVITTSFSTDGIWVVFGFTIALLLVAFLTSALAPRQTLVLTECIIGHPVRTCCLGLLFTLLAPLIVVPVGDHRGRDLCPAAGASGPI